MLAWFHNLRFHWKILLAPTFLILVLVSVATYALQMLRANQANVEALLSGPVLQAEMVDNFGAAVSAAQARLYRLTATAANETDQNKIKAIAAQTSAALTDVSEKLNAFESVKDWQAKTLANLEQLRIASTSYLKHAKNTIEMADGEPGAGLMFMTSAERNFAEIEKITEEMSEVSRDLRDREIARANTKLDGQELILTLTALVAVSIGCLVSLLVSRGISTPVVQIADVIKRIANDKFGVIVPDTNRRDEIGIIASAVQVFKERSLETERLRAEQLEAMRRAEAEKSSNMQAVANEFHAAVGGIVDVVAVSATELEATASQLMKTAETTQRLSTVVAAASEEASANSQSVASATEAMSVSVNEIARQVEESRRIAGEAVLQAERTDIRVNELSEAASHIDQVVKLITTIAGQTNLLALNATIEAARAGEAGRGFAVVAHEVKALASQTTRAAEDIGVQIAKMQAVSQDSVVAIKEIGETIRKISKIATMIAAQVEDQNAGNEEIARNVSQLAQGTAHVSADITDVNRGAGETEAASIKVLLSAKSLSGESNNLKVAIDKFLTRIRAA